MEEDNKATCVLAFEDLLIRDLPKFQPFYFGWKIVDLDSHDGICYQNPLAPNCYVTIDDIEDDYYEVSFVHTNQYVDDEPILHRLMGPASYGVKDGKLENISWHIFGKEYSEFEYWFLVCQLFAAETEMALSMDECRYWIDKDNNAPFPARLNLEIKNLSNTEDEKRTELGAHPVWKIKDQIVSTEIFWKYWEERGYINKFF